MFWLLACASPPPQTGVEPVTYALDDSATTTLQGRWAPVEPSAETVAAIEDESLSVFDWTEYAAAGLGVVWEPGSPWIERDELAPDFVEGEARRSITWLWQVADPQVIDEESPIRISAWADLYRPQGHLTAQVFEAHVRTAARLADVADRPFDFALVAGDLTDGGQLNELSWVLTALNGGVIDPDSGIDDDPVEGAGNDFNDPFIAEGLDAPWYAAVGNHDVLYIGGFDAVTDTVREAAAGEEVYDTIFQNGFRDGSSPGAEVLETGPTPADPDRIPLRLDEYLATLHEAAGEPAGHGLSAEDVAAERGWFSAAPVAGVPLRLLVINTVNHEPEAIGLGAEGFLSVEQLAWLEGELDAADAAGELSIVMSHHRAKDLGGSSPVDTDQLIAVLEAADSLVLHVTGHGHTNSQYLHDSAESVHGYWELMLASTLDFPMQSRIIELVDERNGYLSIYCTNLDHDSPEGSLAHLGRSLAAGRLAFPVVGQWTDWEGYWPGEVDSQNLLLRLPMPVAAGARLSELELEARISSLEALATLD